MKEEADLELVSACPVVDLSAFCFLQGTVVDPIKGEVNKRVEELLGAVNVIHLTKVH